MASSSTPANFTHLFAIGYFCNIDFGACMACLCLAENIGQNFGGMSRDLSLSGWQV